MVPRHGVATDRKPRPGLKQHGRPHWEDILTYKVATDRKPRPGLKQVSPDIPVTVLVGRDGQKTQTGIET